MKEEFPKEKSGQLIVKSPPVPFGTPIPAKYREPESAQSLAQSSEVQQEKPAETQSQETPTPKAETPTALKRPKEENKEVPEESSQAPPVVQVEAEAEPQSKKPKVELSEEKKALAKVILKESKGQIRGSSKWGASKHEKIIITIS